MNCDSIIHGDNVVTPGGTYKANIEIMDPEQERIDPVDSRRTLCDWSFYGRQGVGKLQSRSRQTGPVQDDCLIGQQELA